MFIPILVLIAFFGINKSVERPNGNVLLGITLPDHALTNAAVLGIVKQFRRLYPWLAAVFLLLTAPVLFAQNYIAAALTYILVWMVVYIFANQLLLDRYIKKLYALKKAEGWWLGTRHVLSIDTEVSRLKSTFPVSYNWFALPFAVTAAAVLLNMHGGNEQGYTTVLLLNVVPFVLFVLTYFMYKKDRTVVYSDSTEVNIAINHVYKREWTKSFVIIALTHSIFSLAMTLVLRFDNEDVVAVVTFAAVFVYCLVIIAVAFAAFGKIRNIRNMLRGLVNEEVYEDDDLCWFWGGMFYHNPNDSRAWVEKRIGVGMTVNMATIVGKVTIGVVGVVLVAVTIFAVVTVHLY